MPLRLKIYPKKSPYWQIRGTIDGHSVFESTGESEKKWAKKKLEKREAEIKKRNLYGRWETTSFAEAALEYMERGGDDRFLEGIILKIGKKLLTEIEQEDVDKIARQLHPGCKPATLVRNVYVPVTAVMNSVRTKKMGKIGFDRPKIARPVVKYADDDYIEALTGSLHCPPHLKAIVLFMTYSAARVSEACRMEPQHFDLRGGRAIIERTKNNEPRSFAIPPSVVAAIANIMPHEGFVFGFEDRHAVMRDLKRAAKNAGLPYLSSHKIGRHAFAARFLRRGKSLKMVRDAGGWRTYSIVDEVYGHLEQDETDNAILEVAKR